MTVETVQKPQDDDIRDMNALKVLQYGQNAFGALLQIHIDGQRKKSEDTGEKTDESGRNIFGKSMIM